MQSGPRFMVWAAKDALWRRRASTQACGSERLLEVAGANEIRGKIRKAHSWKERALQRTLGRESNEHVRAQSAPIEKILAW